MGLPLGHVIDSHDLAGVDVGLGVDLRLDPTLYLGPDLLPTRQTISAWLRLTFFSEGSTSPIIRVRSQDSSRNTTVSLAWSLDYGDDR